MKKPLGFGEQGERQARTERIAGDVHGGSARIGLDERDEPTYLVAELVVGAQGHRRTVTIQLRAERGLVQMKELSDLLERPDVAEKPMNQDQTTIHVSRRF